MKIYMKEKIGNPELFTGRKKELNDLLLWVQKVKNELSPSRAILSRRKTGKTALLQRLYNLVFDANNGVIPFYYEIDEKDQWAIDFCKDFFIRFILQYIAFKRRNPEYIGRNNVTLNDLLMIVKKESQDHLIDWVTGIQAKVEEESVTLLWSAVREAPRLIAEIKDERVIQIIDEFQYLNRKIYADKEKTRLESDFAQPYMKTAEYKNAPLLVSGSWIGLLMHDVLKMPGRFRIVFLENMPREEAIEMVYKYSLIENIPVTEQTAGLIADLGEGNPFYISEIMRSTCPNKDLTTPDGVLKTLEFETLDNRGSIKGTWMEYILYAFSTVDEKHAKNIVLYLSQNRHREVSRRELREKLQLTMSESELEKKLDALVKSDIIEEGRSNFYYRGVQDNIFDKVFRGRYADEITEFDPKEITNEYKALFNDLLKKYRSISGRQSHYKGMYAEFMIIQHLTYHAYKNNDRYLSMMNNLPKDFRFTEFKTVWSYKSAPIHKHDIQVDVFAKATSGNYSMIGDVKYRDKIKYSYQEAIAFKEKANILIEIEHVEKAVLFVFSKTGFSKKAMDYLKQEGIAWTKDAAWVTENHP